MAKWTIKANVEVVKGADWVGDLVPQVVEAHNLREALAKAAALPLASWLPPEPVEQQPVAMPRYADGTHDPEAVCSWDLCPTCHPENAEQQYVCPHPDHGHVCPQDCRPGGWDIERATRQNADCPGTAATKYGHTHTCVAEAGHEDQHDCLCGVRWPRENVELGAVTTPVPQQVPAEQHAKGDSGTSGGSDV